MLQQDVQSARQEATWLQSGKDAALQSQSTTIECLQMTAAALEDRVSYLQRHIAYIERCSAEGAKASQSFVCYLQQRLRNAEQGCYHLSFEAASLSEQTQLLYDEIDRLSVESIQEQFKSGRRISDLEGQLLEASVTKRDSEQTLKEMKRAISELSDKSTRLIEVRDDLSRRLATTNTILRKEGWKARKNLDAEIKTNDLLQKDLQEKMDTERMLQGNLQKTVDELQAAKLSVEFYRGEDRKQTSTISSLQVQIGKLVAHDRREGFRKTITEQKASMEKLASESESLKRKNEKLQFDVDKAFQEIDRVTAVAEKLRSHAKEMAGVALSHKLSAIHAKRKLDIKSKKAILSKAIAELMNPASTGDATLRLLSVRRLLMEAEKRCQEDLRDATSTKEAEMDMIQGLRNAAAKALGLPDPSEVRPMDNTKFFHVAVVLLENMSPGIVATMVEIIGTPTCIILFLCLAAIVKAVSRIPAKAPAAQSEGYRRLINHTWDLYRELENHQQEEKQDW
ncbi:hypothetical protein FALCPG4_015436 [Fusarium falciforme]